MRAPAAMLLLLGAVLSGCIGAADDIESQSVDDVVNAVDVPDIPGLVTGVEHLFNVEDVESGAGVWVHGHHGFVSMRGDGLAVVHFKDVPTEPYVVAKVTEIPDNDESLYARDADVTTVDVEVTMDSGEVMTESRDILALAGQAQGLHLLDVTDAHNPVYLANINEDLEGPSHNVAMHPTLPVLYNSQSGGESGNIDVIDISDPMEPVVVGTFGDLGCHDITFLVNEDKERLYCAGVARTQIYDIADPMEGELILEITDDQLMMNGGGAYNGDKMQSFGLGLHHSVYSLYNGELLIIGDEFMGGGGPGCGKHLEGQDDTPLGALWFVEVNEEDGTWEILGSFSPDAPVEQADPDPMALDPTNPTALPFQVLSQLPNCTSHFGDIIPGEDKMVVGWYTAGVLLIDFSDPTEPVLMEQWNEGTNTWDARLYGGEVVTGDIARGVDIFGLIGDTVDEDEA